MISVAIMLFNCLDFLLKEITVDIKIIRMMMIIKLNLIKTILISNKHRLVDNIYNVFKNICLLFDFALCFL